MWRYGKGRVAKAILVSAVPPLMLKTDKNSEGTPVSVFDGFRAQLAVNRAQFFREVPIPFYGFNRPGAKILEGVVDNWWRQGMMGAAHAHYLGIKGVFGDGSDRGSEGHRRTDLGDAGR